MSCQRKSHISHHNVLCRKIINLFEKIIGISCCSIYLLGILCSFCFCLFVYFFVHVNIEVVDILSYQRKNIIIEWMVYKDFQSENWFCSTLCVMLHFVLFLFQFHFLFWHTIFTNRHKRLVSKNPYIFPNKIQNRNFATHNKIWY